MTSPLPDFDPDFAGPAQWAALYRAIGLQIVPGYMPGEGNGSWKRPLLSSWTAHQNELMADDAFARLYGPAGKHVARPNMGLITGRCSRNGFVIDLDVHKNPAALAWWNAVLEVENSGLDLETVEQRTGGGGIQKLFVAPPDFVVPTIKTSIGVDIRGQGGFAVLPPSLHESGQHYDWLPGRAPWEVAIEAAPGWLLEAVTDLAEAHGATPRGDTVTPPTNLKSAIQANGPVNPRISGPSVSNTGRPSYSAITMGSSEQVVNEFGTVIDGREHLMRDAVWHAVLELYRASPIMPPEAEWRLAAAQAYVGYEMKVISRLGGAEKSEGLEREGRGSTEFFRKWRRMMRLWNSPKMKEAAARPPPNPQPEDPAAEFREGAAAAEAAAKEDPTRRYEWLDVRGIKAQADPVWEIHGVIPERALGFIYGAPGTLKTFIALDIGLSLATRREMWWGRGIARGGAVIYISSEGIGSLKFRLMAWEKHHLTGADDAPFYLIKETINFMSEDDVGRLLATVGAIADVAATPIAAVFVDTVSRVLPGAEENLQKDMTMFVYACDQVRQRFDATVIGLHHTNAMGGFRGSTVMPAAGDFMLEVRREPGAMEGSIFAKKIKDAEDGWEQAFKVTEVEIKNSLGIADKTSLVVEHAPDSVPPQAGWPDKKTCQRILGEIDAAWRAGKPWSIAPQAIERYAPRVMYVNFNIEAKTARMMIETWLVRGNLTVEIKSTDSKLKGLKVLEWID